MCARFTIDGQVISEALERTDTQNPELTELGSGDIRPSDQALVIAAHRGRLHGGLMVWGFPQQDGRGLNINARSETVLEKPLFRESALHRRCAVLAHSFYEWDQRKNRVAFSEPQGQVLYLAGIYQRFDGTPRFTILTRAADRTVGRFHDRMPLLLRREDLEKWLLDDEHFMDYLGKEPPALRYDHPFEQLTLF